MKHLHLHATPRRLTGAIAVALAAMAAHASAQTTAAPAVQAPASKTYELPPAPLAATLTAIGEKSGAPIRFDEAVVGPLRAREVLGNLTVQEALVQALRGTNLVATVQGNGFAVVGRAEAATLQPVVIVARRNQAEIEFKADRSDTATRNGANLIDVPESVTILTSKLLESQQSLTVQEALSNVSSVSLTNNVQGTPYYSIRGFSDNSNALVNGVESAFGTSCGASICVRGARQSG